MAIAPLALLATLTLPQAEAATALLRIDDLPDDTRARIASSVGAVDVVAIIEPIYDVDPRGIIEPIYDVDPRGSIEPITDVDPRGIIEPIYIPDEPLPALWLDGAALPQALTRHTDETPERVLALQDEGWLRAALHGDDGAVLAETLAVDPDALDERVEDPNGHAADLWRVDAR